MGGPTGQYVDASNWQGTPNLVAYRDAGHTDLMLKATEGTNYAWDGMQALARQWHSFGPQYRMGYYHWLYGTLSAAAQHAWFWSHVAPVWRAGDWTMTDFEDVDPSRWVSDAQHLAVLRDFDSRCDAHGYHDVYTGNWYLANLPQTRAYLRSRPVVMSDYSNNPPRNPYGLTYDAHQFTSSAVVAGFARPVDYNRWLVDTSHGGGTPITPPEVDLNADELQQGLRAFFGTQEAHDRVMAAARDADIRPEVATAVTAAANLAVRQVLGSKEGQDRISQALMDELAALKAAMPTAAELATAVQAVLPSGSSVDPHVLAQAVLDLFATKLGA